MRFIDDYNEDGYVNSYSEEDYEELYIREHPDVYNTSEETYDMICEKIDTGGRNLNLENMDYDAVNGTYILGLGSVEKSTGEFLLNSTIPVVVFFEHTNSEVLNYLLADTYIHPNWRRTEIIKVVMTRVPGTQWYSYNCIFKTHYLRLIQRKWRSILEERASTL